MRDYNCPNGLRAQILFPACWNGDATYQPDGSNLAYLSGIASGSCPPTHPKLLPLLFFEVDYFVAEIDGQDDGGNFVFAMGDPTGFGFHGDVSAYHFQARSAPDAAVFEEEGISQSMIYILMGLQLISPPHFAEGAATKEVDLLPRYQNPG